jgi:enoyl-CoA hydratase/carnithine racemase
MLHVEKQDGVARVTLNRPSCATLSTMHYQRLHEAISGERHDSRPRMILAGTARRSAPAPTSTG